MIGFPLPPVKAVYVVRYREEGGDFPEHATWLEEVQSFDSRVAAHRFWDKLASNPNVVRLAIYQTSENNPFYKRGLTECKR